LLVFAEGRKTEVGYIQHWHRRHREGILVEIADCHGEPLTLVEAAIRARTEERRDERRGRGKAHDSSALAMLADASSYAAAKERALLLDRKHAGDFSPPRSNPSSDAYRLIDRIRRGNNLAR